MAEEEFDPEQSPSGEKNAEAVLIGAIREFLQTSGRHGEQTPIERTSRLSEDLGLDSLTRAELLARVENRLGVTIEGEEFLTASTVQDLLAILSSEAVHSPEEERHAFSPLEATRSAPPRTAADFRTLNEVLSTHAAAMPERTHIFLIDEREGVSEISYGELYSGARAVAAGLSSRGLRPGQCVALILPTGQELLKTFFGILLAGGRSGAALSAAGL